MPEWCRCGKCSTAYQYLVTEKEYLCSQEIDGLRNFIEGDSSPLTLTVNIVIQPPMLDLS